MSPQLSMPSAGNSDFDAAISLRVSRSLSLSGSALPRPTSTRRRASARGRAAATALLLLLAAAGAQAQTHVTAVGRRHGGGPLSLSVQNEVDAAVGRAQEWLLRRQQPEGSWGVSNRALLTATAGLALLADGLTSPRVGAAADKAAEWLSAPAVTNGAVDREALAWREILLLSLATNTVRHAAPWRRSAPAADSLAALAEAEVAHLLGAPVSNRLADAAGAAATLPERYVWLPLTRPAPTRALALTAALAREWRTPAVAAWHSGDARRAWWLARAINRCAHGELATPGDGTQTVARVDWRHELARDRIGRQRIDRRGDGWWQPSGTDTNSVPHDDAAIVETAFTILLLREL